MAERLLIGDLAFDDGQKLEVGEELGWFFADLIDWDELTESKSALPPRPLAHGTFQPGKQYRLQAAPSVTLVFVGSDAAQASTAVREMKGGLADQPMMRITHIDDDGVSLFRDARIKRAVPQARRGGHRIRKIDVYIEAPDPLLYGAEISGTTGVPTAGVGIASPLLDPFQEGAPGNPGRVVLTNPGTAATTVRLTVTGGLSEGVQILVTETGEVLRLDRLIPDGSGVTFDSRTGRARLDGQSDVTGFMTVDQWPQIPPGATRTFQFLPLGAQSGTPTMRVAANPAYL